MEKRYYNSTSISAVLKVFEDGWKMSSEDFYAAHRADSPAVASIPGSQRQAWAGFYANWKRMTATGFVEQAQRELEPA